MRLPRKIARILSFVIPTLFITAGIAIAGMDQRGTNIILIIGDDISTGDFGCYGHPTIRTPNIDRLARHGIRFTNAYLTTSSCSPTRCSLITGRYPHNTGAPELHMPLPEGQVMFPSLLKEAGYYTVLAGKFHMGAYARNAFDTIVDSKPGGEELWTECLRNRPGDRPFFMWFASHDAHRPWAPDPQSSPHQPGDAVIPPYLIDTRAARKDMAAYYDEVQRLDRYVGQVVEELKEQGIDGNTLVLFMADNGRPFPRCKTRLYDSGIKTPLIVQWPGKITRGNIECHSLVSAIDIAPTLLEIAGVRLPQEFQGISMVPLFGDPEKEICQYVFAEHNWHVQKAHERMVRRGDFVYIRNAYPTLPQIIYIDREIPQAELREKAKRGELTPAQLDPLLEPRLPEELYNVAKDPHQIHNIVQDPAHHTLLLEFRNLLDQWQTRTGDHVPRPEEATPDRINRRTGEEIPGLARHPEGGVIPGEIHTATRITDPGPR